MIWKVLILFPFDSQKYIESQTTHHRLNTVMAFCDSCSGQNSNVKIATLLSFLVQAHSLESTKVNFMQSGHLYLPNDANFGVIEKAKNTAGDVQIRLF